MDYVTEFCAQAAIFAQVLVLPEYGSLELTSLMTPEDRRLKNQAQAMQTYLLMFIETYSQIAMKQNVILVAPSFPVQNGDHFVNRTFIFGPTGLIGFQDKQKVTRLEAEEWNIKPGEKTLTAFATDLGTFGVNIGYDVEFPAFAYGLSQMGVQLLLAPSCTDTLYAMKRIQVGAQARALENQFYVGVAQTVGEAAWSPAVDINTGQALLCGPPDLGFPEDGIIAKGSVNQPGWIVHEIDMKRVQNVRTQGSVLNWHDSQA